MTLQPPVQRTLLLGGSWLFLFVVRLLFLPFVIAVAVFHLGIVLMAIDHFVPGDQFTELFRALQPYVPALQHDISISVDGDVAMRWLTQQYYQLMVWVSLPLAALSLVLRRELRVPPLLVFGLHVGLILLGSILWGVLLDGSLESRLAWSFGFAAVSMIVGGTALAFILGFQTSAKLLPRSLSEQTQKG